MTASAKTGPAKPRVPASPSPAAGERRRSGGRPTRAEAERRHQLLLDVAARLFAAKGLDGISIEAIAEEAGVAKRFLYARYRDKSELFTAVVARLIEERAGFLRSYDVGDGPASEGLFDFAQQLERIAVMPDSLAMFRLIISETHRFPALGRLFVEKTRRGGLSGIVRILETYAARGELVLDDPVLSAELFFLLTIGGAQRRALIGLEQTAAERSGRIAAAVQLFLHGCARRPAPKPGDTPDV